MSYAAGLLLLAFFVGQLARGEIGRRSDMAVFQSNHQQQPGELASLPVSELPPPDTSLWSARRISYYQASPVAELPPVLGALDIPAIGLKIPVYSSDSGLTIDPGAGIIDGMAYPHEEGNTGIAGHHLSLQNLQGAERFTVERTRIVEIHDIHVLEDTDAQSLALVTC